jgi:hypothetical protein
MAALLRFRGDSMILKGLVSSVQGDKLAVILPEKENIVTPPLMVYGGTKKPAEYKPNDFVLVVIFNDNITDGVVLGHRFEFATDTPRHDASKTCAMFEAKCIRPKEACSNCTVV